MDKLSFNAAIDAAIMATPDSVLISHADNGLIVRFNDGFLELIGRRAEEVVGHSTMELDVWVHAEERARIVDACLRHGFARNVACTIRHSSGEHRSVLMSAHVIETDDDPLVYWVAKDISELKDIEATLRRYETMWSNARDIMLFVRHADGLIIEANPAAVAAYGYTREELLGMRVFDLRASHEVQHARAQLDTAAQKGARFQTVHRRRDGSTFPVEVDSLGVEGADGSTVLVSLVRDVSERQSAEKQLRLYSRRLRVLAKQLSLAEERERERLARELHDRISQPIAVVRMQIETLRAHPELEPQALLDRSSELLGEALAESRALTNELSPPALHSLNLESGLEALAEKMRSYGLECDLDLCTPARATATDERSFIYRAARELLLNAVKHSGSTRATLSLAEDASGLTLLVSDDGDGFDPEETLRPGAAGSTFGLFSIEELAAEMGATVTFESAPGEGATISIRLPYGIDEAAG